MIPPKPVGPPLRDMQEDGGESLIAGLGRAALWALAAGALLYFAVMADAAELPFGIVAAGSSYNSQGSPKAGGWVSIAYLLTKTGGGTYSYTTSDITMLQRKAQASMRTGAAQVLHQYGPVTVLALAEAGVATTGAATGGALTAGGVVAWQVKGWAILGAMRHLGTTIGPGQNVVEVGFGRTF